MLADKIIIQTISKTNCGISLNWQAASQLKARLMKTFGFLTRSITLRFNNPAKYLQIFPIKKSPEINSALAPV